MAAGCAAETAAGNRGSHRRALFPCCAPGQEAKQSETPVGPRRRAHGSPASNASQHLGQSCVVTLDVKDFFTSVRYYIVYRMIRHEVGMGRDVARLLTRLTT